jgi:hypothetical protein
MRPNWKVSAGLALFFCLFLCHQLRGDEPDLIWSTFLGGSDYDLGYGIAVDGVGDVYVTGVVTSEDFPEKAGILDTTHGGRDLLVAKLCATGDSLVYATLLGGGEDDEGKDLAVDKEGNVYVTGVTNSEDFPTTVGAFGAILSGDRDVVVAKLDPSGAALRYATYLGGSSSDWGNGLAVDGEGNAFVVGYTNSENFPTTTGSFDETYNGGYWDAFAAKLDSAGRTLAYSTFLGGEAVDNGQDIALDGSGCLFLTGNTSSGDFPTTAGAYDTIHNGGYDVFVTKLDPASGRLDYSTFLGGELADYGYGIALDRSGYACLAGTAISVDFPTTPGAYDQTHGEGYGPDGFVAKLDAMGSTLEFSTYLGGTGTDEGRDLAVDDSGNVYVSGWTYSADFPSTPGAFSPAHSGYYSDAFMAKLDRSGSMLTYGTFLGGSRDDLSWAICVDGHGNVFVTGESKSPDFPTTPDAFSDTLAGDYADIFVAKLNPAGTPVGSEMHEGVLPASFSLQQNYPNPFNASTEIRYQIPEDGHVTLKVFNTLGQEVRSLVEKRQLASEHSVVWAGRDNWGCEVASGVYFCRLQAGEFGKTIKMALIR